mmetsp:Transcript_25107/g.51014  ORF Transcript_25107/g.51014 Transcript_25107/m.51014 type:complete len:311 (-) Transcript_25107:270-1202(-)
MCNAQTTKALDIWRSLSPTSALLAVPTFSVTPIIRTLIVLFPSALPQHTHTHTTLSLAACVLLERRRLRERAVRRPRVLPDLLGGLGGLRKRRVLVVLNVAHRHPKPLVEPAEQLPRRRVEEVPLVPLQEVLDLGAQPKVGEVDRDELVRAHHRRLRVHRLEPTLLQGPAAGLLRDKRVDVRLVRVQRLVWSLCRNVNVLHLPLGQRFSLQLVHIFLLATIVHVPCLNRDLKLRKQRKGDCGVCIREAVVRLLADRAARFREKIAKPAGDALGNVEALSSVLPRTPFRVVYRLVLNDFDACSIPFLHLHF